MNLANCKQVIREMSNYLDGDLSEDLKQTLETHLKLCHHCHVVFDTTRQTIALYCNGKLFALPEDVRSRLHEAVRRKWKGKAMPGGA